MTRPKDWKTAEYGSHWAVINDMFRRFDIQRVLETGSGLYSTPLFLTHPISRLVSIENNPEWNLDVLDERHTLKLVEGRVADHLPDDLMDFDLVFVDDDPVRDRPATIEKVLGPPHPLVILHDTDHPEFKACLQGHDHQTYESRSPWTSVVWPNG